ncbi:MAG: purine-cytosine permease family protein [Desulfitobacteriaceae bacterium]
MTDNEQLAMDSSTNDYVISQVPETARKSFYNLTAIWVSIHVSISAFLVGGVVSNGSTTATGLGAIFLGNLVLVIIAGLIGTIGFRTGLTTYSIGRIVFGKKGSVIVSLVLGCLAMGFIGVLMSAFSAALHKLIPFIPVMGANIGFACLITFVAIFGFKGLSVLSRVSAPALWIFLLTGLFFAFKSPGSLSAAFALTPNKPMPFASALGSVMATWVTGAMICSDITRFSKKAWHVWGGAFVGYVLGAGLFEAGALLMAKGAGNPDVVAVMSRLGLLLPGVLLLLLALWSVSNGNLYSSTLAFTNAAELFGVKVSKTVWIVLAILIALFTSVFNLAQNFSVWLGIIGTTVPPFGGIVIAHFWILNTKQKNSFKVLDGFNFIAFIVWVVASLIAKYVTVSFVVPAILGLLSAVVLYTLLSFLFRRTNFQSGEALNS